MPLFGNDSELVDHEGVRRRLCRGDHDQKLFDVRHRRPTERVFARQDFVNGVFLPLAQRHFYAVAGQRGQTLLSENALCFAFKNTKSGLHIVETADAF